jgi:hypothetical protein
LILQNTIAAFKTQFPMLNDMATDFNSAPLRLNDTVTAHVEVLPTAADFDASTGYANGATEGRSLLVDVPVYIDKHRHVPVKLGHLNLIKDQKNRYGRFIANQAYVLGKEMVDSILSKANTANVSYGTTEAVANWDLETLEGVNSALNIQGAPGNGRVGIISTLAAGQLALDTRIASNQYYGQLTGGSAYRVFRNIAGFQAIYEYPDLPTCNAASGTFTAATTDICTKTAHGFLTGSRVRLTTTTTLPAGLSTATDYYVIKSTADTFKLATTRVNAIAGTAVDITDTGTGTHSIVGYENTVGFFFTREAIALRAGIPDQTAQLAAELGVPQIMLMEAMRDPDSGFSLAMMKWQQAGTGDLILSPTAIWGSSVGNQSGAAASITDKAAHIVRSA